MEDFVFTYRKQTVENFIEDLTIKLKNIGISFKMVDCNDEAIKYLIKREEIDIISSK